jgi:FtsP/CotA-like multicopper oxidase with cupredoxin domain
MKSPQKLFKGGTHMGRRKLLFSSAFIVALLAAIPWGAEKAQAGPGILAGPFGAYSSPSGGTFYNNSPAGVWSANINGNITATTDSGTPLAKFVDRLPGLGNGDGTKDKLGVNGLGQYIPVAVADTTTYPGCDYYQIGLQDYTQKLHTNLAKATKLRGYYQINGTDHTNQYLGPFIISKSYNPSLPAGVGANGQPVRILFENHLGIGTLGDTFIPMDPTLMGADTSYTQNRATLHLHGGATPWISDGTPHQWVTPFGQITPVGKLRGVGQQNVPDMYYDSFGAIVAAGTPGATTNPGVGKATFYYTNQQSGRLMFYHDHAYGTTRLNVYAGEAAGFLLYDQTELDLIKGTNVSLNNPSLAKVLPDASTDLGTNYTFGIPLVIQDKTFVAKNTVTVQDTKWTNPKWGVEGDLWFPHVYETNQNPNAVGTGANDFGRWDYGPWFWPPVLIDPTVQPASWLGKSLPQVDLSTTPEAFSDTPLVNGTAYPFLPVQPKAYRFRILNAANDRPWNLQLYVADPNVVGAGAGKEVAMVYAAPRPVCTAASPAAIPTVPSTCTCGATLATQPFGCFPATWPTDGRDGGVPDPQFAGPKMIQIGTEGGILPSPVVLDNQPVGYEYNRRNIVVLDILNQTLLLGPAERADVIIDFSAFAGKNIILYNDAPAPNPAFDPRYDYFTNNLDATWMGGAPTTLAGFGPNTRTIMQFQVAAAAPQNVTPLYNDPAVVGPAGTLTTAIQAAFKATQAPPIVPETTYNAPGLYPSITKDVYGRIFDNSLTFTPIGAASPTTVGFKSKAIQELWDPYGRMNATLGVELPFTNNNIQTTIPLGYVDPATEFIHNGETQLWKITHNGVDTHPVHFHLYNVQLINRVGWDGAVRPPEPNELGWKETVRMKPLEDVIVAFKSVLPQLPFAIPNSVRLLNPAMPAGDILNLINPVDGNAIPVANNLTNFGHEYVWHCHILGHEENDFMRPQVLRTPIKLDFENDGIRDLAVWRSSTGNWYVLPSSTNTVKPAVKLGKAGDIPVAGDFDGDSKTDLAVWRPSSGIWYILNSSTNILEPAVTLGSNGDIPVPADYDGDGKTDKAVWKPSTGVWSFIKSSDATAAVNTLKLGKSGDIPVPADYDGDGAVDMAVWRPTSRIWFILDSSTNTLEPSIVFGTSTDIPVPGDFDGDGKADKAVYHTDGSWSFIFSTNNPTNAVTNVAALTAHAAGDIPLPGEYCGNQKVLPAIWRPSNHTLYTQNCTTGALRTIPFAAAQSSDTIVK